MITKGRFLLAGFLLLLVSAVTFSSHASQAETPVEVAPERGFSVSGTPSLSARSFLVLDAASGEVLAEAASDAPLPIASITKLPAAAAWLKTVPLEATTTIAWSDVAAEGRAGKLSYGEVYTHHDLLLPLLLESSNDAAAAMERVTNNAIVTNMNELAETLSLSNTHFADASGLSSKNVSTASEIATLITYFAEEYPHVLRISTLPQYIHQHVGWVNNSPVIAEAGYLGGKHGFTYEANRTAAALFEESISGDTREVVYVVLGSDNLKNDVDALREFVRESVRYE